jgi:hypothetical protein
VAARSASRAVLDVAVTLEQIAAADAALVWTTGQPSSKQHYLKANLCRGLTGSMEVE